MDIPRIPKDAKMADLLILAQVTNNLITSEIKENISSVPDVYIKTLNMVTVIIARCLAIENSKGKNNETIN